MISANDISGFLPRMKRKVLMSATVGQIYGMSCLAALSILVVFLAGYTVFPFETASEALCPIVPATISTTQPLPI